MLMTKCLTCKGRISARASRLYTGDFCSEYCFSSYPGQTRKLLPSRGRPYQPEAPREAVAQILERNCHILKAFGHWRQQSPVMDDIGALQWMREKGFDFDYHTRVAQFGDGSTEVWCYEVGYRLEKDGRVEPLPRPSS